MVAHADIHDGRSADAGADTGTNAAYGRAVQRQQSRSDRDCERAKFGHMSHGQMFTFMQSLAKSLNHNSISGGPFGILRKAGGENCNGYSCDVVCAGQGGGQRQFDVLGDINGAGRGPLRLIEGSIRVDVCEIQ